MPAVRTRVGTFRRGGPAPVKRRNSLSPTVVDRMAERDGLLPVWIRCPKTGPEHYAGFSRAKLYELAGDSKIRSVSIREPGQVRGTRLFHLGSILEFIAGCEAAANAEATAATTEGSAEA